MKYLGVKQNYCSLSGRGKEPKWTLDETEFCIVAAMSQTPTGEESEPGIDGFRRHRAIKRQRSIKSGELRCMWVQG